MQYNNEQSTDIRSLYTRASIVVFGGVCAVLMANHISNLSYNETRHALIPGFNFMAGLCYPILYFWGGLLLRTWKKNPKWWIQLIVLLLSILCLYRYRHFAENWNFIGTIYFAMAGVGFLIPSKVIASLKCNKGWISLMMLMLSVFCYTVLETTRHRLLWGPLMKPEFADMELMLETILVNAEPLMMIVVIYFAIQFAFSRIAQYLGSQSWFRGIVAVPCILMFIGVTIRLFDSHYLFYMVDYVYYSPLLWFIAQPITIYLFIVGCRCIRELRKKKEDRMSWKEMLRID